MASDETKSHIFQQLFSIKYIFVNSVTKKA